MAAQQSVLRGNIVGALACQKDSYLRAIDTEVVSCVKWSPPKIDQNASQRKTKDTTNTIASPSSTDLWFIEFADSLLFPEGGGQPSDHGLIWPLSAPSSKSIPITFVQRQGLRCIHHSPEPLPPGTKVRQEVDFKRRWDHMQQHTGQHLLSAIMDTYNDLETLGWGMGADGDMNYVDLPRKPSPEEMQTIQDKCNEAVRNSLTIKVETPDNAETDSLPGDYDKDKGVVRVVSIGNLDRNTCCGTHLSQTSHISLILLHSTQNVHAKNCRLYFTAGDRAIKMAADSIQSLRFIARIMCSGNAPDDVVTSVQKTTENMADLKRREKRLLSDIAEYEAERVKDVLQRGKNAWVYRTGDGLDFMNLVVVKVKDAVKERGTVILASGEERGGGQVVIVGEKDAVPVLATKVKEIVKNIKGGGKGDKWQGKVTEWGKGELEALKSLVEL